MAHPSPDRTAAIDELTKGHELVSQLGAILPADTGRALLDKISDTFSRALVVLKSRGREGKSKNFDAKKRKIESEQKSRPRKRKIGRVCSLSISAISWQDLYSLLVVPMSRSLLPNSHGLLRLSMARSLLPLARLRPVPTYVSPAPMPHRPRGQRRGRRRRSCRCPRLPRPRRRWMRPWAGPGTAELRSHFDSRTIITTNILDDGHSWRKYGQKNILDLKFPRCYFRCSNKFDQNCPAMRQVQQSEEDSSLYVITYIGEHTCQSRRSSTASLAAPVEKEPHAACIINFGSANPSEAQDEPKFPSPSLLATAAMVGPCEEGISSTLTHGSSMPAGLRSSTLGAGSTHLAGSGRPEHGDVTSCLQEEDDSVWDLELDYFNFTDVLGFD